MIRSSERAALQIGQAALVGEARIHCGSHARSVRTVSDERAEHRHRHRCAPCTSTASCKETAHGREIEAAGGQRLERCHTACEMAHALGILHAPVEVAALGYDWVAGSLQADVALEELYGLYLFVAGLTTRHVEDGSHGRSLSSQPSAPLKSTDSFPGPQHTTAFIHRWPRPRVSRACRRRRARPSI